MSEGAGEAAPERFVIPGARTWVVSTPDEALERRRTLEEFFVDLELDDVLRPVRFPRGWLAEGLGELPELLERRPAEGTGPRPWMGTVIDRQRLEAVGQIGCLALPDADGVVEVRYATNAGDRNRGYATEAGDAFVSWLLTRPGVRAVVAECLVTNVASVRVLEKTGFELLDEREDEAGRLLRWIRR